MDLFPYRLFSVSATALGGNYFDLWVYAYTKAIGVGIDLKKVGLIGSQI